MYKKLFWGSVFLWVVVIGIFVKFFVTGQTTSSPDNRRAVILTPSEREVVLGEMRTLLVSLNGILKGLAKDDFKTVSIQASNAGAGMAADLNPALMAKLPLDFKTLGMSLHKDFDQLSVEVNQGMDKNQVIARLGDMTNKCLACHAAYKIEARE